ncbi:alkaline phosphatase family protein [Amycolatopsis sp. FDAARGOS 1241]|uniref:alkaline phosphatase family protein n=1 Tax=Amycolatopsis sp. FDAARGOS 1241 TaxID=2778070 RepID=UPI0019510B51|nr:nucleotide pyrophosphatase/phosphodiesterase family protein [Amycolatopsis sp. FDAARGOS 1241]QRP43322.1 alkaline phosphatase family protein [Amycolatopsis sp. FDAARGOS 1241]
MDLAQRYAAGTLADVVPSALAGLGVPGERDALGLPAAERVCVLLVDGLGWELLRRHAETAPFLSSLAARPLTAGFPSTTATSVASLGTGLTPGEHGVVGYAFEAGRDVLNVLGWRRHTGGKPIDLRQRVVPEQLQPRPTAFERAAAAGVGVCVVGPRDQRDSGLTRAALRGGEFRGVHAFGDLVSAVGAALAEPRSLCYAYHADLDLLGHVHGPGSEPWCFQLSFVDRLVEAIAGTLPAGSALVVTADHGMVTVGERVDFDTTPALQAGVRTVGGEARARHVYASDGAAPDVLAAWRETLGERAWVLGRDEAVAAGWFGPRVNAEVLPRIGDVVAAARGTAAVVRTEAEPRLSRMTGQHGSVTDEELVVPLLIARR